MTVSQVDFCRDYARRLHRVFEDGPLEAIGRLATALREALHDRRQVFLAGNGGSAANAIHLANDFLYGMGKEIGVGLRVEALPANTSVLTCLANDVSYDAVFAEQLKVKAQHGDILIVLSGSGNSSNIVRALETGRRMGMQTFAILGCSGGRCRDTVDVPIHFSVDDMQLAEDLQLMVGHMCMQWIRLQVRRQQACGT